MKKFIIMLIIMSAIVASMTFVNDTEKSFASNNEIKLEGGNLVLTAASSSILSSLKKIINYVFSCMNNVMRLLLGKTIPVPFPEEPLPGPGDPEPSPSPGTPENLVAVGNWYYLKDYVNNQSISGMDYNQEENEGNCFCIASGYAYMIHEGRTSASYSKQHCSRTDFGLIKKETSDNFKLAFKQALKGIPSVLHAAGHTYDENFTHYVTVVGITKSSYDKYVNSKGEVNETFKDAKDSDLKNALVVRDPWPKEETQKVFVLTTEGKDEKSVPYYDKHIYFYFDTYIATYE